MTKAYYTLCVWDTEHAAWFDVFGSYERGEVVEEMQSWKDAGNKAKHLAIIKTDETADAMMKARDALPAPK